MSVSNTGLLPVAVSVVLYNTSQEYVQGVMRSVLASSLVGVLYIVDNSERPSFKSDFKEKRIRYIVPGHNLGYGAAHNLALDLSRQEGFLYHLVLNPDIWFESSVIDGICAWMDKHPKAGCVMPKVLYPDGRLQRLCKLYPTPFDLIVRRFIPLRGLQEYVNYKYELHFFNPVKATEVPLLAGCFMFLRTAIAETKVAFDKRYFLYLEDYDLCRQLRRRGWKLFYLPQWQIYHGFGKGSHHTFSLFIHHVFSAFRYLTKWGWFFDNERHAVNARFLARYWKRSAEQTDGVLPCHPVASQDNGHET